MVRESAVYGCCNWEEMDRSRDGCMNGNRRLPCVTPAEHSIRLISLAGYQEYICGNIKIHPHFYHFSTIRQHR